MRRIPQDDYKKLLPLKKIAEASSYSFGYVSILVQRKKLKARKIGNKYYSTKEWFDQYLEYHGREDLARQFIEEYRCNLHYPDLKKQKHFPSGIKIIVAKIWTIVSSAKRKKREIAISATEKAVVNFGRE